jgi:flagellar biosynthesis protein FlhF
MKIVRHVARDMRQAMRAIRERLGEDAVILSSRRVSDGVEVTAARRRTRVSVAPA